MSLFRDRRDAGRQLARELGDRQLDDAVVLGLARGGMPVAHEIARRLELPLDVFVVRKLGVPFQPELAFGAIATGDVRILNDDVVTAAAISPQVIARVTAEQRRELKRREDYYRGDDEPIELEGRTALLVDDGIATGASLSVAIEAIAQQRPARIIAASPLAPPRSRDRLAAKVDELICLATPTPFGGVGAWYDDFKETTDDEVRALLTD